MAKSVKSDILTSNITYDANYNTITYPLKDDVDELKTSVSNLTDNESKLKSNVSKHTLEIHDLKVNLDRATKDLDTKIIDASIQLDKAIQEHKNLTKIDIELLEEKYKDLDLRLVELKREYDTRIIHLERAIFCIVVVIISTIALWIGVFNFTKDELDTRINSLYAAAHGEEITNNGE